MKSEIFFSTAKTIAKYFHFLLRTIFSWIEEKAEQKFYVYFLIVFCLVIDLLFVFPKHFKFYPDAWATILLKSQHLTDSLSDIYPGSYLGKKVFRLTVPFIMKIFGMNELFVKITQYLLGLTLLFFVYKIALKLLKDPVSATFLAVGTSFAYFGRTCFMEFEYAYFDGWGYCFLILATYFRNRASIFLFTTAAAWTDERAFVALPAIMLFHQIRDIEDGNFGLKRLISMNLNAGSVFGAMTGYLVLRQFLAYRYNMIQPTNGISLTIFSDHNSMLFLGIATFFVGFWIVPIIGIYQMTKCRDITLGLLVLLQIEVSTFVARCVFDLTRSGSYLFPIIFVFLVYLKNRINRERIRLLTFTAMSISFIIPAYCVMRWWSIDHIEGRRIPVEFLKWLFTQCSR